jgi:hypothetical protein
MLETRLGANREAIRAARAKMDQLLTISKRRKFGVF